MRLLNKEEFICLDCETTGLDVEKDRIIEVAAVRFTQNEIIGQTENLIDPEMTIPEVSIAIHHITQDMVTGKPKIAEILPALLKFIGSSTIIGHGVSFDIQLLINAAKRDNIPCKIGACAVLDTLRLARLYGESPTNSLETLRQHFHIAPEGLHRAMGDALVNVEVFKNLTIGYKTVEQLLAILAKPIQLKTMPLGKYKGKLIKEIPIEYLLWAGKMDFDQDLLFSIRSEINRRKKGNTFTHSNNPFSQL